jgi:hypothetical protein
MHIISNTASWKNYAVSGFLILGTLQWTLFLMVTYNDPYYQTYLDLLFNLYFKNYPNITKRMTDSNSNNA